LDKVEVLFVKFSEHTEYADTDGMRYDQIVPRLGITISARTKDGAEAFGAIRGAMGGLVVLRRYEKPEDGERDYLTIVQDLARRVAREAIDLDRAQGTSILGADCPVILAPQVAGVLAHEVFGHTSEADIICENRRSKTAQFTLKSRLGAQVSDHPAFNMIDTGSNCIDFGGRQIKNGFGSLVIDEQGCEAKETHIIDKGIQVNVLNDRYTFNEIMDGLKDEVVQGMKSHGLSGNVRREKYDMPPQVRMTNTFMLAGESDPEDIIRSVPNGIYCVNFGGGQVDITSGNFVFSASESYMIEGGKITRPVRNATLIGNGPEALKYVSMVGSDLSLDEGIGICGKEGQSVPVGVGIPTIKIDRMTVGGTA
jgi:TldD protein